MFATKTFGCRVSGSFQGCLSNKNNVLTKALPFGVRRPGGALVKRSAATPLTFRGTWKWYVLGPGRSETSCAAVGFFEVIGPGRLRSDDLFDDELAYLTSGGQHDDLVSGVVEQTDDLAAIV